MQTLKRYNTCLTSSLKSIYNVNDNLDVQGFSAIKGSDYMQLCILFQGRPFVNKIKSLIKFLSFLTAGEDKGKIIR